jgi:hypothetical protein
MDFPARKPVGGRSALSHVSNSMGSLSGKQKSHNQLPIFNKQKLDENLHGMIQEEVECDSSKYSSAGSENTKKAH